MYQALFIDKRDWQVLMQFDVPQLGLYGGKSGKISIRKECWYLKVYSYCEIRTAMQNTTQYCW